MMSLVTRALSVLLAALVLGVGMATPAPALTDVVGLVFLSTGLGMQKLRRPDLVVAQVGSLP